MYCLSLCPCLAWLGGVSLGLFLLEVPGSESQFCPSTVWLRAGDLAFLGHLRPESSQCSLELTGEEEPWGMSMTQPGGPRAALLGRS